ncbi:lipid-transfer protein [Frankia sp. AgB1.9]|uniref:lipid-transfer protein n=1 Tax=unclassified Frankia TaxID=2632575 RepID=UPI0019319655|nr:MULTISPECIES: lipid-transfer protein [unclassified Frankia]MBL7487567.1 lipid-transfer protein [Frankia sp. AgW1.1]MBL7549539.1 lipid-transfer protein [Frankia sp. AgB1.9]MBL7620672.1 lipid-transfer protein [Frankia sp. AgB1.8]
MTSKTSSKTSTDIAVIGWAQAAISRRTDQNETQMLMASITDALTPLGLTRDDVDFTCLGSCDYITGQAFSFVANLDAIGAWPPKRDSHVEMDGAWALYEAWLRLHEGDIDIAVVTGSGRSSTGDPSLIYPMEMDPYVLAPLGADLVTFAALQARAMIAAGLADERAMAEVAIRSRGKGTVEQLLAGEYVREPLRRHDLPPITDGAVAMVLATGERARQLVERPAYITGFDHRTECHNPAFRRLDDSPSTRIAAREAGLDDRPVEVAELQASFTHEELLLRHVLGLGEDVAVNPSGGALRANPIMATGLARIGYAADHIFAGGSRALGHATSGPCLQQNLICVLEGRS